MTSQTKNNLIAFLFIIILTYASGLTGYVYGSYHPVLPVMEAMNGGQ